MAMKVPTTTTMLAVARHLSPRFSTSATGYNRLFLRTLTTVTTASINPTRHHHLLRHQHHHHHLQQRSLTTPSSPVHSSTALLEPVKAREEGKEAASTGKGEVGVKEGGKGSEGRHSKDGLIPLISDDLTDKSFVGPWTISHPIYTDEELEAVQIVRRETKTFSDKVASGLVALSRKGFDFVTFYRHKPIPQDTSQPLTVKQLRDGGYILTDQQWLSRILMLESIAGVPGMVAGVCRHLRSLRLMRRDGGWIHTLLSEAENERMHLLTFMTIKQPSVMFRAMVLGIQGVFFNLFFLTYLVSPAAAHRFVGYLEEEACITYTRCIEDMKKGWVPEWQDKPAPSIAIDYWRLAPDANMLDVIKAVRADEATHRFVNHTLANLDQKRDFNPFALKEPDPVTRGTLPGYTREEAAEFARRAHEEQEQVATRIHVPPPTEESRT